MLSKQYANTEQNGTYITSAMQKVYNYMFAGLLGTGSIAYLVSHMPELQAILFSNPIKWLVIFAPLACVLFLSFKFDKLSTGAIAAIYALVVVAFGVSLSTIFLIYTTGEISAALFSSSIIFIIMSIYGHVTKKDLSSWGQFLIIGLIGLIIAQIVNMFIGSSALTMALSAIGVIIFTLFTAYDTQKIKEMMHNSSTNNVGRLAIMGALTLYLDFINLFINLLQIMSGRK
jgi:FtsH-binding integral membrane protein